MNLSVSGNPGDYIIAFLGGLLVSFTPCVYPLLPVSASYIGVTSGGSRLKGFSLSLVYVTGVAITYSILGLAAALTGSIFGRIASHPATYAVAGLVFIVFGIAMLDVFHISIPHVYTYHAHKKHNYLSTFFLGLSSGLLSSPCLTPVLGSILLYLTGRGNLFYGMTLLFTFAYGMGFTLILVGTFSSLILSLPKAGGWLIVIKRVFACVLMGVGVFFIVQCIKQLVHK